MECSTCRGASNCGLMERGGAMKIYAAGNHQESAHLGRESVCLYSGQGVKTGSKMRTCETRCDRKQPPRAKLGNAIDGSVM